MCGVGKRGGSGVQIHEEGEATSEGQAPEPNRQGQSLRQVEDLVSFIREKGDPEIKKLVGLYYARRLLGFDPMGKRPVPEWMIYALSGLPYPMTWWESHFGRSINSEQDRDP